MSVIKVNPLRSPYYVPPVGGITFTPPTVQSGRARTLSIQVTDGGGVPLAQRAKLSLHLSTAADGGNFASAATSIAGGTNGAVLQGATATSAQVITNALGQADIVLTEAATRTDYLAFAMPDGTLVVGPAIAYT